MYIVVKKTEIFHVRSESLSDPLHFEHFGSLCGTLQSFWVTLKV